MWCDVTEWHLLGPLGSRDTSWHILTHPYTLYLKTLFAPSWFKPSYSLNPFYIKKALWCDVTDRAYCRGEIIWSPDNLKFFFTGIPQGPLETSPGIIKIIQKRLQGSFWSCDFQLRPLIGRNFLMTDLACMSNSKTILPLVKFWSGRYFNIFFPKNPLLRPIPPIFFSGISRKWI